MNLLNTATRVPLNELALFCRRVGVSVCAGVSLVASLERESRRSDAPRAARDAYARVLTAILDGETLAEAVRREEAFFGAQFVAMLDVAEQSGLLGETLQDMAGNYEQALRMRREFVKSLYLPVAEFLIALAVIGLVIVFMGVIASVTGEKRDLLGLGLIGMSGLRTYLVCLAAFGAGAYVLYRHIQAGAAGSDTFQHILARIPKVGTLLKKLAEVRLARSLALTLRTGMDVRRAVSLAFDAAAFAPVRNQKRRVLDAIEDGESLGDGFIRTRGLDLTLVHNVCVGEETGETPELMRRTADIAMQEAVFQMKQLSVAGFFLVFLLVAGFIIYFIFRIASFYTGTINDAIG